MSIINKRVKSFITKVNNIDYRILFLSLHLLIISFIAFNVFMMNSTINEMEIIFSDTMDEVAKLDTSNNVLINSYTERHKNNMLIFNNQMNVFASILAINIIVFLIVCVSIYKGIMFKKDSYDIFFKNKSEFIRYTSVLYLLFIPYIFHIYVEMFVNKSKKLKFLSFCMLMTIPVGIFLMIYNMYMYKDVLGIEYIKNDIYVMFITMFIYTIIITITYFKSLKIKI